MHGELLHGAVDRCSENFQPGLLGRLDDILSEGRRLGLRGRQLAESSAAIFLDRLLTLLDDGRQCGFGLVQMALLHAGLLLLLDQLAQFSR